jgi:hypothetical protein
MTTTQCTPKRHSSPVAGEVKQETKMEDAFYQLDILLGAHKILNSNMRQEIKKVQQEVKKLRALSPDRPLSKSTNSKQRKKKRVLKLIADQCPKNVLGLKRPEDLPQSTVYRLVKKLRGEGLLEPDKLELTENGLAEIDLS